jgi:hypothetical protein
MAIAFLTQRPCVSRSDLITCYSIECAWFQQLKLYMIYWFQGLLSISTCTATAWARGIGGELVVRTSVRVRLRWGQARHHSPNQTRHHSIWSPYAPCDVTGPGAIDVIHPSLDVWTISEDRALATYRYSACLFTVLHSPHLSRFCH